MARRNDELLTEILIALSPEGTVERIEALRAEKQAKLDAGWAALNAARDAFNAEKVAFEAKRDKIGAILGTFRSA
jgi:hypothetical protein